MQKGYLMGFDLIYDPVSEEDVLELLQELEGRMIRGEQKGLERPEITHCERYLETVQGYQMGSVERIPLLMNMGFVRAAVKRYSRGVISEEEEMVVVNRLLQSGLTPVEEYAKAVAVGEYIAGKRRAEEIEECFHGLRKRVEKACKEIVDDLFDVEARLKDIKITDFTGPVMLRLSADIAKRLQDGEGKAMDLKDEMKLLVSYAELQAKATGEDDQGANTFNMAIFMSEIKQIDSRLLPNVEPEYRLIE